MDLQISKKSIWAVDRSKVKADNKLAKLALQIKSEKERKQKDKKQSQLNGQGMGRSQKEGEESKVRLKLKFKSIQQDIRKKEEQGKEQREKEEQENEALRKEEAIMKQILEKERESIYEEIPTIVKVNDKKLKIVAISDTHANFKLLQQIVSTLSGDIFIHAGDFTHHGRQAHFHKFFSILDRLNFTHKIVISGNHEIMLDSGFMKDDKKKSYLYKYPCKMSRGEIVEELKKRCIYLEHEMVEIVGVKIFGSPYSPNFCNSAFQYQPQHDEYLWGKVPKDVDILVTHSPPFSILDTSNKGKSAGSKALKAVSLSRKPKYHIFGHIHESQGMKKINNTLYINVAKQATKITYTSSNS